MKIPYPFTPFTLDQKRAANWPTGCFDAALLSLPDAPLKEATTQELYSELRSRLTTSTVRAAKGETAALVNIVNTALLGIEALRALANRGDEKARSSLFHVAATGVAILKEEADKSPTHYRALASKQLTWPLLFSPQMYFNTDTESLQKVLQIGSKYRLALLGKGSKRSKSLDPNTPINKLALSVIDCLWRNQYAWKFAQAPTKKLPEWIYRCRSLPEFSRSFSPEWAAVGWEAVVHAYDGKPETEKLLHSIGKHRGKRAQEGSGSEASGIREEIKAELKTAMDKLAPA